MIVIGVAWWGLKVLSVGRSQDKKFKHSQFLNSFQFFDIYRTYGNILRDSHISYSSYTIILYNLLLLCICNFFIPYTTYLLVYFVVLWRCQCELFVAGRKMRDSVRSCQSCVLLCMLQSSNYLISFFLLFYYLPLIVHDFPHSCLPQHFQQISTPDLWVLHCYDHHLQSTTKKHVSRHTTRILVLRFIDLAQLTYWLRPKPNVPSTFYLVV